MSIDMAQVGDALATAGRFLADNREPFVFGAGAVGVLLAAWLAWRWWRHGEQHTRLGAVALALATLVAAEGQWELFTGPVDMAAHLAVVLFSFLEITMVSQGMLAKRKIAQGKMAAARKHMRFMVAVAVISGVLAASAGGHVGNVLLRLVAPAVAAAIWWMELTADQAVDAEPTSWIWTPRRIGIELGLVAPGEGDDLDDVLRRRRVRRIVKAAAKERAGGKRAERAGRRLDRLALVADAVTVTAAREQLGRAMTIRTTLFAELSDDTDNARTTPVVVAVASGREPASEPSMSAELSGAQRSLSAAPSPPARPVPLGEIATVRRRLWLNPEPWNRDGLTDLMDSLSGEVDPGADDDLSADSDGMIALARTVVADLSDRGERVNRQAVADGIRATGRSISSDRLAEVWRVVRTDADSADKGRTANGRTVNFADTKTR